MSRKKADQPPASAPPAAPAKKPPRITAKSAAKHKPRISGIRGAVVEHDHVDEHVDERREEETQPQSPPPPDSPALDLDMIGADADLAREMGGAQKVLRVETLVPNPWNPQTMNAATFAMLVDEIKQNHCIAPVTVVDMMDGTYRIIGGEHRWRACKQLGKRYIPAFVMDLEDWDEERQRFETVRLNMLHGQIDPRKFLPLYEEAVEKYGADAVRNLFRFSDEKQFKEIVAGMSAGVRAAVSPEMADEFDKRASRANTVEDLTAIVQDLFAKGTGTLDECGYMVFTLGGKEHVYVPLDQQGKRALNRVQDWLKLRGGMTMSQFMAPLLDTALEKADADYVAHLAQNPAAAAIPADPLDPRDW